MPGLRERRAEHCADAARTDDSDGEAGGVLDAVHAAHATAYRAGVMIPWRQAWHEALYGPSGFYRGGVGPVGHFTTSTHGPLGAVFAEAIGRLADREDARHVVDVGCGRGELLTHLHAARPDLALTGVDVVSRPHGIPDAVAWVRSPGGGSLPDGLRGLDGVLVVAHEWLDVVPCTIAQVVAPGRLAVVLVDPATGEEALGNAPSREELAWVEQHWPIGDLAVGSRVEIGLTRDTAWNDLVSRVRRGAVLAVDYGHRRVERPADGTLSAYRAGALVVPMPDGTCDLTAHVAVDSLEHDELGTQRDWLRELGVTAGLPAHELARTDAA